MCCGEGVLTHYRQGRYERKGHIWLISNPYKNKRRGEDDSKGQTITHLGNGFRGMVCGFH